MSRDLSRPIKVVGGTYVDVELATNGTIEADTSLAVTQRASYLGGAGFCFAMQLAKAGFAVELWTLTGECEWSDRAREALNRAGICIAAGTTDGPLDVATLVIDRSARKLALNEYRMSQHLLCPRLLAESTAPLLVASPTSIPSLVDAVRLVNGAHPLAPLYLAPHSYQVAQIRRLAPRDRELLAWATTLACFHSADFDAAIEMSFPPRVPLVVTRGAEGCRVRHHGEWSHFAAPSLSLPVSNPNGAGEAFFAAVVAAIESGCDLPDAVQAGTVAAGEHLITRDPLLEARVDRD